VKPTARRALVIACVSFAIGSRTPRALLLRAMGVLGKTGLLLLARLRELVSGSVGAGKLESLCTSTGQLAIRILIVRWDNQSAYADGGRILYQAST
jgi:hypothetical protein